VQELLHLLGELVRAEDAEVAQPRPVAGDVGILEPLLQERVLDLVELQGEEQQLGRDPRQPLLDALVEAADLRILHGGDMHEAGIGAGLDQDLVEALKFPYGAAEIGAGKPRDLVEIAGAEARSVLLGAVEVGLERGGFGPRIEVAQVPGRQLAEPRLLLPGCRLGHRRFSRSDQTLLRWGQGRAQQRPVVEERWI
jgi:hypothetical protein